MGGRFACGFVYSGLVGALARGDCLQGLLVRVARGDFGF